MDPGQHTHWIAGQPVSALEGFGAELRAGGEPWESLGAWPQAGPAELASALEVLELGAERWGARPAQERQHQVARWMRLVCEGLSPQPELGLRLGFGAQADWLSEVQLRKLARELDLELARPRTGCGPVAVLVCHWSELASGLLRGVGSALQAGRAVLLLADPRVPMLADRVHADLLAAGLPGELLAVLHGLDQAGLEQLAGDERVGDLLVSSSDPACIRRWRAFGERVRLAAPQLRLLRARSFRVGPGDGALASARRVLREAFSGPETLHGQAPGQVARVHCHALLFSAFSEALLAELEASGLSERGLPMIDQEARDACVKRWSSGLDQGATLIAGGELCGRRGAAKDLRVLPTVLTNVEPHMQCARSDSPAPVLCLLRTDQKNYDPDRASR